MKRKLGTIAAIAIAAMLSSTHGYALTNTGSDSRIKVEFVNSERFTDIEVGQLTSEREKQAILSRISESFQKQVGKYLDSGYTAQLSITNVDLAGENNPKPPYGTRYRLYRDTTPPSIAFDYTVLDATDQVVASGSQRLTDRDYKSDVKAHFASNKDTAHIEFMIAHWASRDLRKQIEAAK